MNVIVGVGVTVEVAVLVPVMTGVSVNVRVAVRVGVRVREAPGVFVNAAPNRLMMKASKSTVPSATTMVMEWLEFTRTGESHIFCQTRFGEYRLTLVL